MLLGDVSQVLKDEFVFLDYPGPLKRECQIKIGNPDLAYYAIDGFLITVTDTFRILGSDLLAQTAFARKWQALDRPIIFIVMSSRLKGDEASGALITPASRTGSSSADAGAIRWLAASRSRCAA